MAHDRTAAVSEELPPPQGYIAEKLGLVFGMLKSMLTSVGILGERGTPVSTKRGRTTTAMLTIGKGDRPLAEANKEEVHPDTSRMTDQGSGHTSNPYSVPGLADNLEKLLHETPEEHAEHAKNIQAMHEEMAADRYRRQIAA